MLLSIARAWPSHIFFEATRSSMTTFRNPLAEGDNFNFILKLICLLLSGNHILNLIVVDEEALWQLQGRCETIALFALSLTCTQSLA